VPCARAHACGVTICYTRSSWIHQGQSHDASFGGESERAQPPAFIPDASKATAWGTDAGVARAHREGGGDPRDGELSARSHHLRGELYVAETKPTTGHG